MHEKVSYLDGYKLKIIAIAAMTLDHIGAVFFPHIISLRVIGRITAPVMAFFIAEGYTKTQNVKRYMLRLFSFATLSMVPYCLVFGRTFNILFDLFLGLLIIYLTDKVKDDYCKWGIVLLGTLIAMLIGTEGRMGISALAYLFYRFRNDKRSIALSMSILYLSPVIILSLFELAANKTGLAGNTFYLIHPFSLIALPLIFSYNGERGRYGKYLFYIYYPGHLMVIYVIMRLLHR